MRIAPDVEKLMWMVADSADPQAIADFESRFPELRYELSKRIDMVRELKSSRRLGKSPGQTPHFRPSPAPSPSGTRWKLALAFAALSALAFGSFFVTRSYFGFAKQSEPTTTIVRQSPPTTTPSVVSPKPVPQVQPTPPPSTDSHAEETPSSLAPWDRLQTIRFEKIPLQDALRAIAAQSGLKLEIAPGMPNPLIKSDYRGMTGLEILADMGPQFGFTAFHQGEGQVIVIPARDSSADALGGDRNETPDSGTAVRPEPAGRDGG